MNLILNALSWTALFRAFSSHRQPSASLKSLTARGSRYDFPGVDHEGRQTFRLILIVTFIKYHRNALLLQFDCVHFPFFILAFILKKNHAYFLCANTYDRYKPPKL